MLWLANACDARPGSRQLVARFNVQNLAGIHRSLRIPCAGDWLAMLQKACNQAAVAPQASWLKNMEGSRHQTSQHGSEKVDKIACWYAYASALEPAAARAMYAELVGECQHQAVAEHHMQNA